jgi:DNA-directed RNA polymerase subunit omega
VPQTFDSIDSKFRYILIAAKRARQLQAGSKALVHTAARKPTRIAQEEIRAGMVKWELTPLIKPVEIRSESEDGAPKKSKK